MSRFRNKHNNPTNVNTTASKHKCEERGQDIEMTDMKNIFVSDSSGLSVHQFACHAGPVHQHIDTDFTALHSPSSLSHSVPAKADIANPKHVQKSEQVVESSSKGKAVSQDKKSPAYKVQTTSMEMLKANADDDDLDLSSLRDLMESMRQAAKEIREITNPVHVGKTKKKEHATRPREQKRHQKKKHGHRRSSGHHQQIQAEIHVISEVLGQNVSTTSSDTSQLSLPLQTEEEHTSPPSSPPTAFLHVENEELSNTWPRRRGRSVSRQRSMTDNVTKPGACSEGNSPMVLAPDCNLWLQTHQPTHAGAIKADCRSSDKLTVHQSGRHHSRESGMAHSKSEVDFEAITMPDSRQNSRGRAQERSSSRVRHPAPPSPSPLPPHSPTSPPPHIFVSEHDVFPGPPQQEIGPQREPAEQEIAIDIV